MSEQNKEDMVPKYLFQTLVNLYTTLASVEKELSRKNETILQIATQVQIVSEALKAVKESKIKSETDINEILTQVKIIQANIESQTSQSQHELGMMNEYLGKDLTEIKSSAKSIQEILIDLKAKNSLLYLQNTEIQQEGKREEKKVNWFKSLIKFFGALKNFNTFVIIAIVVFLIIMTIIFGPDATTGLWKIVKLLFRLN